MTAIVYDPSVWYYFTYLIISNLYREVIDEPITKSQKTAIVKNLFNIDSSLNIKLSAYPDNIRIFVFSLCFI